MNRTDIPGFRAEGSLSRKGQYQQSATGVQDSRVREVIPQVPAGGPGSWDRANWIRDTLRAGSIHCYSKCPTDPEQTQVCSEVCYWWPW